MLDRITTLKLHDVIPALAAKNIAVIGTGYAHRASSAAGWRETYTIRESNGATRDLGLRELRQLAGR